MNCEEMKIFISSFTSYHSFIRDLCCVKLYILLYKNQVQFQIDILKADVYNDRNCGV